MQHDGLAASIVIPCFNSGSFLEATVKKIADTLERDRVDFECILVDDGSSDNTWEVIKRLEVADPRIFGTRLRRNSGQHIALIAGSSEASKPIVVTLDDDGQNPPTEIRKLITVLLSSGLDVVYGVPIKKQQHYLRRATASAYRSLLAAVAGIRHVKQQTNFRAFRKDLVSSSWVELRMRLSLDALLYASTDLIGTVTVSHRRRVSSKSRYSFSGLLKHALNVAGSSSTRLLNLGIGIGLAFFAASALGSVALIFWAGQTPDRQVGFASISLLILFTAGVNMLVVGIVGLYVGKIFRALGPVPAFLIQSRDDPFRRQQ